MKAVAVLIIVATLLILRVSEFGSGSDSASPECDGNALTKKSTIAAFAPRSECMCRQVCISSSVPVMGMNVSGHTMTPNDCPGPQVAVWGLEVAVAWPRALYVIPSRSAAFALSPEASCESESPSDEVEVVEDGEESVRPSFPLPFKLPNVLRFALVSSLTFSMLRLAYPESMLALSDS